MDIGILLMDTRINVQLNFLTLLVEPAYMQALDAPFQNLYRLPAGSPRQEIVQDSRLSHHVAESLLVRKREKLVLLYNTWLS